MRLVHGTHSSSCDTVTAKYFLIPIVFVHRSVPNLLSCYYGWMSSNLHLAGPVPDWQNTKPGDRSYWQSIAAKTKGAITPGNAVSVAGLGIVVWGLMDIAGGMTIQGIIKISIGRTFDLIDGWVAHKTATKSSLGEATDATVDKLSLAIGLPVLILHSIIPIFAGAVIGLQNIVNVLLAFIAKGKARNLHPSRLGKIATIIQWATLILYGMSTVFAQLDDSVLAGALSVMAHLGVGLFLFIGTMATMGYAKDTFKRSSS